ncbi:MAG: hypothetical protein JXA03_10885 [Bacteroidales bacterium]|nr:hypothetical protein [Bacteroidales bacterium]
MLILKGNGNNISSHTAIRFIENATQEVDRLYDVYKLFSDSPEIPNLYSGSDSEELALNTLPSITGNEKVPVWFRA